jgi:hypothetical protein
LGKRYGGLFDKRTGVLFDYCDELKRLPSSASAALAVLQDRSASTVCAKVVSTDFFAAGSVYSDAGSDGGSVYSSGESDADGDYSDTDSVESEEFCGDLDDEFGEYSLYRNKRTGEYREQRYSRWGNSYST